MIKPNKTENKAIVNQCNILILCTQFPTNYSKSYIEILQIFFSSVVAKGVQIRRKLEPIRVRSYAPNAKKAM